MYHKIAHKLSKTAKIVDLLQNNLLCKFCNFFSVFQVFLHDTISSSFEIQNFLTSKQIGRFFVCEATRKFFHNSTSKKNFPDNISFEAE